VDKISRAAAFIRGLSFDGEKGKIVFHTSSSVSPSGNSLDLGLLPEGEQELLDLLKARWSDQDLISCGGDGNFVLAGCYDEAVARVEKKDFVFPSESESVQVPAVKDKVALVTGGAQGFGEGMVRELVTGGAYVYIADMNIDGATRLAESLNQEQGSTRAFALKVNVTDETSVEAMMDQVARCTGGLDIFISNAGVLKAGSVKEMTLRDFQFVTDVDYTGFFICTKFASRLMSIQNMPTAEYFTDIIGISSKSGLEGSNKNGAYAGAKFGSLGLTQSFALELVTDNIKVNSICPGNFLDGPLWSDSDKGLFVQYLKAGKVPGAKTLGDVRKFYEDKVPMKRGCETKDVVKAIFYIVDQKYETGQAVPVTGGQVMLN
jgi:sorbitol-6-phosphate 2-dehydrogenase